MKHASSGVHTRSATGVAYYGPGDMYTFLISGEQAGDAFFAMEGMVPPGGGPPPHTHANEDETLYILDGECHVQIGDNKIVATKGDFVYLPRDVIHCFKNEGAEMMRLILTFVPAGIEKYFEEVFDPVTDRNAGPRPPTPEFIKRLVTTAPKYGVEFHLPG